MKKRLFSLCVLGILIFSSTLLDSQNLKVHFIDVRQGDAILIQYGGDNYLIDSGKNLSSDKLITYIDSIGVTHLNCCLITHPDFDHYGEFEDLVESGTCSIDKFIVNKDTSTNVTYQSLMALLSTENIPVDSVDYQDELNWTMDTDILSPDYSNGFPDDNDNSIVIKLTVGEVDFLFTGDSCEDNNQYLMDNYDIDIDVLKVSHHGGITGTSAEFLAQTTPIISIISSGNNSYGHPSAEVIDLLQNIGSQVYSTADDWDTWWVNGGNGSNDESLDDDILVETDGSSIWVNGQIVWSNFHVQQGVNNQSSCEVFPNPCDETVTVYYHTKLNTMIDFDLYDVKGRLIENFYHGQPTQENSEFVFNIQEIPSGIYFLRYKQGQKYDSSKLLILH